MTLSFQNYLLLEINACYINILTLNALKFNLMIRASIFQNFSGGHALRLPSISMLFMLIVLRTMEQYSWLPSLSYALFSGM